MYARLMAKARLRHLQLLVAVADQGNLRRAAEEVGLSQPAATQALAEIEHLLESPLFERHAKGMRLTADGAVLMPVIRNVLGALQASTDALATLHDGARGQLRVGAITAVASAMLGERVLRFCARHPEMQVELIEDYGAHLLQELQSGRLDIVLGRRPLPMPIKMHFEPLRPDTAIVVAGLGHPLAGRAGLVLADLAEFPWMRPSRGVWAREVFDALFDGRRPAPRLHQLSTASLAPLPEILRDRQTLALLPSSLGRSLCRWNVATELDVTLDMPRGELGVICATESLQDPVYLEFIAALRAP